MNERVAIETITPAQAEILLAFNVNNRNPSESSVEALVRALPDAWMLSNDMICIVGPGMQKPVRVLNGQHRLMACVESGHPIRVVVMYGADERIFPIIDSQRRRRASDALPNPYARQRAAAAMLVKAYDDRRVTWTVSGYGYRNDELVDHYFATPELGAAFDRVAEMRAMTDAWSGIAAAVAVVTRDERAPMGSFLAAAASGANLQEGSPILALLSRLRSASRVNAAEVMGWTLKAWRAYDEQRPMNLMKHRTTDPFPQVPVRRSSGVGAGPISGDQAGLYK
jgi:hypothetical protein